MDQAEFRAALLQLFGTVHVDAWLARQPTGRRYGKADVGEFVNYLNSLPDIGRHENE